MARTVLVVTDRPSFVASCQPVFAAAGASVRVVEPARLAEAIGKHDRVLFDSDSAAYQGQDDELLVALGFARALMATPAVASLAERAVEIDDLAADICPGLVAHSASDLPGLVLRLMKRAEGRELPRFEYVTLSPRDAELLAILSSGDAVLLSRPCSDGDDGSDVTSIDLADDAASATLGLTSGASFVLSVDMVAARAPEATPAQATTALDGARVGSRLRELRKAAGLTQAELARRTGIHRPNIARVEAGRHTPSLDTLARIAAAIGVSATRVLSAD